MQKVKSAEEIIKKVKSGNTIMVGGFGLVGACTVGAMNLANPYITEYYPRDIRTTGMGYS
jgi:acyl CoA:acetate/3-ketoacid CoA transferase alpha subunit